MKAISLAVFTFSFGLCAGKIQAKDFITTTASSSLSQCDESTVDSLFSDENYLGTSGSWLVSSSPDDPVWSNSVTTGKTIDGSVDEIQLKVQGHSTQTNNILKVERSDGSAVLQVTDANGTAIRGTTTNDAADAGFVGELISDTTVDNSTLANGQYQDAAHITLSAGTWDIQGTVLFFPGSTTVVTRLLVGIGTNSGTSGTGVSIGLNASDEYFHSGNIPADQVSRSTPTYRVQLSASTTYYLKAYSNFSGSNTISIANLRATRIR